MSNRIKELRYNSGLTLQQLSEAVGIGKSTLASYESRGVVPRVDKAKILADYFDVSLSYVTGYDIDSEKLTKNLDFLNSQTKKISDKYKKDTGKTKNPTIKELRQYVNDNQERKINEDIKQLNNISYNLNEINRKKLIEYAKDLSKLQNFEKEKDEDKK
ncbi:helix-turn-helix domain-containing protein [Lactococcus lactis]|uniref:helix-turn-helix domain-containing protein n=1 Tax=Lactococcus lactis TaxID=1358 RepID=UPI0018C809FA|nr:helix-turn-helix transcriptional regulator [Lactococcus lactis]MBG1279874.1 helix-turn-helix domain-containing protein [Lactococcus lactis subsp. lactis]